MANVIAGLAAQLGLDTTEFKKGISEAKSSLKELKEYLPEALSAAAVYELIHASMELSNKIVETAKANEVSTESVLRLSKALEENGGQADNVGKVYSGFTQKLEAAVQGNATAQTSFAKLGVTLKDLATLSEQDLFEKTVTGLANMKDAAERNGLAFQTLGKGIRGVDLKGMANTLEETKGEFDKYARAVEMAHELSLKLDAAHKTLVLNFNTAVIPSLVTLYDKFVKVGGAMDKVWTVVKYLAMGTATIFHGIATGVEQLMHLLEGLGKWAYDFSHVKFSDAGKDLIEAWEKIKGDGEDWKDFIKELQKSYDPVIDTTKKHEDAVRVVTLSYAKLIDQAKNLSDTFDRQEKNQLTALQMKERTVELTKKEKEVEDAVNKVYQDRDKALSDIQKKINETDVTKLGGKETVAELHKQEEAIKKLATTYAQETEKAVIANQKMREEFGTGWSKAYQQYTENAETAADFGAKSFNTVVNSMDTALSNFVKTGKLNFADLARSIIQNLIQIQLQMQASKLFSGLLGGLNLGTAMNYGTLPGSDQTAMLAAQDAGMSSNLPGRASGGPVSSNTPYMVGEVGPELFVPQGAGTIIPNNQLGGTTQTTNVTNYNISAIDTKSFEDRIYGSSNAIWAANSYAQKNLAVNRSRT